MINNFLYIFSASSFALLIMFLLILISYTALKKDKKFLTKFQKIEKIIKESNDTKKKTFLFNICGF